jgi:hypothetical protein
MAAAKGKTHVDVAFWGGVVPGNQVSYIYAAYTSLHKFTGKVVTLLNLIKHYVMKVYRGVDV